MTPNAISPSLAARLRALSVLMAASVLAACGGGGGEATPPPPPPPASSFTQSGSWTFNLPASGTALCYDFDTQAEVAGCAGNDWDLRVLSSGLTATLWTNSGTSGTGDGAAVGGPFEHTWTDLATWQNGTTDPVNGALPPAAFLQDSVSSVFTGSNSIQSAAFEYAVTGGPADHSLYPNYRVFLITTNNAVASNVGTAGSPVFALQVTGYYGGATGTTSGYPSFRWVDRADPATVRTATVNASAGWVYYDLVNGAEVGEADAWQIAFNRYSTKLNGGASGSGTVGGFRGKTPAGFYDGTGAPIASRFTATTNTADTLADLTAGDIAVPANANAWVRDATTSPLNPTYRGTYPNALDYGWLSYFPTAAAAQAAGMPAVAHVIRANDERGTIVRSGEGNSYARIRLSSIAYADPNVNSSQQTWTFQFDVQPRP